MLAEVGLTPRLMRPDEDWRMPELGLGLTDLAKGVAGMDHQIPPSAYAPQRLAELAAELRPAIVAFTSLTAARKALSQPGLRPGRLPDDVRFPGVVLFALPSPSGAARATFDADPWYQLAQYAGTIASDHRRCG